MPSLVRFLIVVGVLAALVYGAMLALVTFVEPVPRLNHALSTRGPRLFRRGQGVSPTRVSAAACLSARTCWSKPPIAALNCA